MARSVVTAVAMALLVAICSAGPVKDSDPVRLSVFYETLCPDSIKFMEEQLAPTWADLKDIMYVDLTAYGFVEEVPKPDGGYRFHCQHGEEECQGNILLTCAKKLIADHNTFIDYSLCVMTSADPPSSGEKCAMKENVNWADISNCTSSVMGEELLHDEGLVQDALVPAVNYVPWMIVNDAHNEMIQQEAEFHLEREICTAYTGVPPAACNSL